MSIKKIVCADSGKLAVIMENVCCYIKKKKKQTTNVHMKPFVLQKQHINRFDLKLLPPACEVLQNVAKGYDSDWALNLNQAFMLQFVVDVGIIAQTTIKRFGVVLNKILMYFRYSQIHVLCRLNYYYTYHRSGQLVQEQYVKVEQKK